MLFLCGYQAATYSLELFYGISLEANEIFPLFFPILAAFFLSFTSKSKAALFKKRDPKPWYHLIGHGALSLFGLLLMSYGLSQVWSHLDALYFVMYMLGDVLFASSLLLLIYPLSLFKKHKLELGIFLFFFVFGLALMLTFQFNWKSFVDVILIVIDNALSLFTNSVIAIPQLGILGVRDFTVTVGLPCIGLTSFFLFFGFYGGIGASLFSEKQLNTSHFVILFLFGLLALFILNIVRIGVLMIIGGFYSPEFAITLFHEFAGFALFIGFIIPYFYLTQKWLQKPQTSL